MVRVMSLSHITTYMGPALLSAVVVKTRLKVPQRRGRCIQSQFANWAGPANPVD